MTCHLDGKNYFKMIKFDLNEYSEKLESEKLIQRPAEHYYENDSLIILFFKARDRWEYYTSVLKSDIMAFSGMNDLPIDDAINMFKINYCSGSWKVEDIRDFPDLMEEAEELMIFEDDPLKEPIPVRTSKSNEIDAGTEMVEEADGYSDFLLKTFDLFEKKALAAVDNLHVEKSLNKNFGEFMRSMFNAINTLAFMKQVRKFLRIDLEKGMDSAESELGMDIGFTDRFQDKLNVLSAQQIDGYTINGKKWFGIKGITKELQSDLIVIVQGGVNDKKSIPDIKKDIQTKFDNFSNWKATMIARTETNRVVNEGKLTGYKESGLEGGKVVIAALDARTSEICERLDKRYSESPIPLDDPFIDSETNKAYMTPPFHPNCRSSIGFVQD